MPTLHIATILFVFISEGGPQPLGTVQNFVIGREKAGNLSANKIILQHSEEGGGSQWALTMTEPTRFEMLKNCF